jgi:hypothetical protein
MPMPVTRPMRHNVTTASQQALPRSGSPSVRLPPSQGVQLPYGQGVLHTVKDPGHVVPMPKRAAVT